MKKNSINHFGFTLLEILVVIGIIAILVGLISTSYSTAQKKARDSRRKTDVKQIQSSLEQYYSICGYAYPNAVSTNNPIICTSPSTAIMPTVPTDPQTTPYVYTRNAATNSYSICTNNLESESPTGYCLNNQQ